MKGSVRSDSQLNSITREIDTIYRSFFVNVCAGCPGMIKQHFVEITACHLISVISLRTVAVFKVKLAPVLGTRADDFAAVFFYEPGAQEFFVQTHSRKRFHAERQQ